MRIDFAARNCGDAEALARYRLLMPGKGAAANCDGPGARVDRAAVAPARTDRFNP